MNDLKAHLKLEEARNILRKQKFYTEPRHKYYVDMDVENQCYLRQAPIPGAMQFDPVTFKGSQIIRYYICFKTTANLNEYSKSILKTIIELVEKEESQWYKRDRGEQVDIGSIQFCPDEIVLVY